MRCRYTDYLFFCSFFLIILPLLFGESWIIVDQKTGGTLEEEHSSKTYPIGTLSELALLISILDWSSYSGFHLNSMTTIPTGILSDPKNIELNPLGFQPGDKISYSDLLKAIFLQSDHIATQTLAYYLGLSLSNPLQLSPINNAVAHMNALARKLKMTKTLFLTPSGLPLENGLEPYSSAIDLAKLTRYAYNRAGFRFFVAQSSAQITIYRGNQLLKIALNNQNPVFGSYGVDGVKIDHSFGNTSLILSGEKKPQILEKNGAVFTYPRRVIIIVLNTPQESNLEKSVILHAWNIFDNWTQSNRPENNKIFCKIL